MKSRDLGTDFTLIHNKLRRSFDSLRSLRMTSAVRTSAHQTTIYRTAFQGTDWLQNQRMYVRMIPQRKNICAHIAEMRWNPNKGDRIMTCYINCRLVDGTGKAAVENAVLITQGSKIVYAKGSELYQRSIKS